MSTIKQSLYGLAAATLLAAAPAAHAQWAVVDVGAIAQLVRQVAVMESELSTAREQLLQAGQTYRAMTGDRGMESLVRGTVRNYLPTNQGELNALLHQDGTAYAALARAMRQAIAKNAVLSGTELAALPPDASARIETQRRSAALLEAVSGDALRNASGRFAALRQLIDAIGTATDQKASLDLEARISGEQAMLANERTKLQVLFAALKGRRRLELESEREQVVAEQGNFSTRFRPVP